MIKGRSDAMFHTTWACHLQPVAAGVLPAMQEVVYRKY